MVDDAQLLRQFVECRSERAFAELIHRHLPLVYHAALRQLGPEKHLADDVAQSVFLLLAGKSQELLGHSSLAGWLHAATRLNVSHALRTERRRRAREQVAFMDSIDTKSTDWEQIRPVLDQVLSDLKSRDREAILLRYFENRPFGEIAARLRVSETAAYKCVERALDKLHAQLIRRGITSSATALAALLEGQGAIGAPAGLAPAIAGAVAASGLPVAATGIGIMTTKMTLTAGAIAALLAMGGATYEIRVQRHLEDAEQAAASEVRTLETEVATQLRRMAELRASVAKARGSIPVTSATSTPQRSFMEEKAVEGRQFLKAHPEVEAALVANYRASLRYQYAELITKLGLSEAEIDRFLTAMIRARTRVVGDHVFRVTDEPLAPGEYTRELKAALGETGYQQFKDFERTTTGKGLADDLVRSLYYTDTPLLPGQIAELRTLVNQLLDDPANAPRYTSVWPFMPAPIMDQLVSRASAVLSGPQLDVLRDLRQQGIFFHAQSAALTAYHQKK